MAIDQTSLWMDLNLPTTMVQQGLAIIPVCVVDSKQCISQDFLLRIKPQVTQALCCSPHFCRSENLLWTSPNGSLPSPYPPLLLSLKIHQLITTSGLWRSLPWSCSIRSLSAWSHASSGALAWYILISWNIEECRVVMVKAVKGLWFKITRCQSPHGFDYIAHFSVLACRKVTFICNEDPP